MKWDSNLYDSSHGYVSEYGKALIGYLPEDTSISLLDLGCGTGTLTAELAKRYRRVVGVDSSADMIAKARANYPNLELSVCDALELPYESEFDAVFSNAVFHWINDHRRLLGSIRRALKPGGMLVCEFGADGNIAVIESAFSAALREIGIEYRSKYNFPTAERFGSLLNDCGFEITALEAFERPTPLKGGSTGLRRWAIQFYASELAELSESEREQVLSGLERRAAPKLLRGGEWIADYRRLRAAARLGQI